MNGKWLMRVLCGMLVVAAVLAVVSLAMVRPVGAAPGTPPGSGAQPMGCPRTWEEQRRDPCGSCDWFKQRFAISGAMWTLVMAPLSGIYNTRKSACGADKFCR